MQERIPKVRLFVEVPLAAGASVELSAPQAHYLGHVMRLGADDVLLVFNGRDGEWGARIEAASRGRSTLVAEALNRPQVAETGPWLLFAPLKKTAVDFIAEKATELGASRLWPVFTRHTDAVRVNTARLGARAVEAAEQCRRLTIPEVPAPVPLKDLPRLWPAERPLVVLDERGRGRPIAEVLRSLAGTPPPGFLVGPEGGFAATELDALAPLAFVRGASLGPRILRAETAAIAALVCWQALVGDWTEPPAQP